MNPLDAALSAIRDAVPETAEFSQQLIAAKCRGMMFGYHHRWQSQEYLTVATEEVIESDLWNPDTGHKSRSFRVAGKIDVRARYRGRLVLVDHKTCSEDIADPAAPYWRQLVIESQPSHYMLLEWLNGRKIDDAMWDVARKPSISPKGISKKEAESVLMTKEYFGRSVSEDSLLSVQQDQRETLEMYEARLAYDCISERPERYFQRRSVPRMDAEIHEYARELWEHGQEMLHVRRTGRNARNSGACMNYGRPCTYLGICSGFDTPESDKWRRKECVHAELLPIFQGDGRDVLTNSRIRCFQTCRKLHWFKYELGIERQDEEEVESLFFGNLWHEAQRAWWDQFKERNEHEHNDNGSPVSEIGTAAIY